MKPLATSRCSHLFRQLTWVAARTATRARGTAVLLIIWACGTCSSGTAANQDVAPLKPPDRSSPRATLQTFLDSCDAVARFWAERRNLMPSYAPDPEIVEAIEKAVNCLDLREIPPAARMKIRTARAMALYETLSRIKLPPLDRIPGSGTADNPDSGPPARWLVPDTEIALVRMADGPHEGDYFFSADTVSRAEEFFRRVRDLPYLRPVPVKGLYDRQVIGGGSMIPFSWIEAMPAALRSTLGGQAVWKWIALVVVLLAYVGFLWLIRVLVRRFTRKHPLARAAARLSQPLVFLATAPYVTDIMLFQINLLGDVGSLVQLVWVGLGYLAFAWLSLGVSQVIAEGIIASPKIAPESIDAHLIRICTRLLGVVVAAGFLVIGADRLGIPVYGVLAGLGIGGIAIALAAQSTIENLIGGLSLFADKPIRVGDFCRYGSDVGTVEAIGIRSTRLRGLDRTLTTIPNALLSKMAIVNFAPRDRVLLRNTLALRHETTPEQLRYILARLRELLVGHSRLHPEPTRARLTGFQAGAFEIEVLAYVATKDWAEFLAVQEDILLRMAEIVRQAGTSFARPTQTLYLNRDSGTDGEKSRAAEVEVQQWREQSRLPFPDLGEEQVRDLRGKLAYPPTGSTTGPRPSAAG